MIKYHKVTAIIAVIVFIMALSAAPLVSFYFTKPPSDYLKNTEVTQTFAENTDPYFSFIVMSDTSTGLFVMDATTLKLIGKMNREDRFKKIPIDFVVNVGDVTYRGKEWQYKDYSKLRAMIDYPVIDVVGNHDDDKDPDSDKGALFKKYCGDLEFSFADRNSYFIALDNRDSDLSEEQFARFEKTLETAKEYENIFVFIHKPPFNPYCQTWYRIETTPWSYRFMKLCEKYKVKAVFSGHLYAWRVAEFGGVKYVVSGGGGALLSEAPSWENGYNHYIMVKVNHDYVDFEVRRVYPPAWLYFTFYFWRDVFYYLKSVFVF